MAMKPAAPVIIIKKRRGGGHGGHHGGAWKVAYADFVTAMMAFFLVMWLVSQSQEVKESVAGYFREPGVFEFERSNGMLAGGTPGMEPGRSPDAMTPKPDPAALQREKQALMAAAEQIRKKLMNAPGIATLRDQIEMTLTSEGLRVELVERAGSSFFDSGSSVLRGESTQILGIIARELKELPNDIVLEGHTDSRPYANGEHGYGNWELSSDRANAARRAVQTAGIVAEQIKTVRGFADRQLHVQDQPLDPRNRRVSIVVRSSAAAALESALQTRK
jgi:chemotaxis protein MotB